LATAFVTVGILRLLEAMLKRTSIVTNDLARFCNARARLLLNSDKNRF